MRLQPACATLGLLVEEERRHPVDPLVLPVCEPQDGLQGRQQPVQGCWGDLTFPLLDGLDDEILGDEV